MPDAPKKTNVASGLLRGLSQQQVAALVGKPPSYFREHVAWIPRNEDGSYDAVAVVAAFLHRKSDGYEKRSPADLKRRLMEAEAKKAELQVERMEREEETANGDLVSRSDVIATWKSHAAVLVERLENIPDQIAPMLPPEVSATLTEDIRNEIRRVLVTYSEGTPRGLGIQGE